MGTTRVTRLSPRSAAALVDTRTTRGRLTDVERAERRVSGGELQTQITDLAEVLGYEWMAVGPLRTAHGWRTPTRGPLGAGWPDLFLVNWRRGRVVVIEVKRQIDDPLTPDQVHVHAALREAGLEVHVARPSDLRDPIEESELYKWLR